METNLTFAFEKKKTNSLAILRLRKPLKTSTRLVNHGIWTRDLPNTSLVRYHGATLLGDMALFTGIQHLCTFNIVTPLFITFCQMFGRRRTPSERPSLLMFRIDRPIARISSSLVLYWSPRNDYFTLAKRSYSHGLILGEYVGCSRISKLASARRKGSRDSSRLSTVVKNDGVLYHQVLHAVPENILVYYDFVPLQFWSRNVALIL